LLDVLRMLPRTLLAASVSLLAIPASADSFRSSPGLASGTSGFGGGAPSAGKLPDAEPSFPAPQANCLARHDQTLISRQIAWRGVIDL
jgi:hypothetical protein